MSACGIGSAFYDSVTKDSYIFTALPAFSDQVRVKDFPSRIIRNPQWSPDGLKIAFFDFSKLEALLTNNTTSVAIALFVMDADGSNEKQIAWADYGTIAWDSDSIHSLYTRSVRRPPFGLPAGVPASTFSFQSGYFYMANTVTGGLAYSLQYSVPANSVAGGGDGSSYVQNLKWRDPSATGWPQTVVFSTQQTTCDLVPIYMGITYYPAGKCKVRVHLSSLPVSPGLSFPVLSPVNNPPSTLHEALPSFPGAARWNALVGDVSAKGVITIAQTFFDANDVELGKSTAYFDTITDTLSNIGTPGTTVNASVIPGSNAAIEFSPDGSKVRSNSYVYDWAMYRSTGQQTTPLRQDPFKNYTMSWFLAP